MMAKLMYIILVTLSHNVVFMIINIWSLRVTDIPWYPWYCTVTSVSLSHNMVFVVINIWSLQVTDIPWYPWYCTVTSVSLSHNMVFVVINIWSLQVTDIPWYSWYCAVTSVTLSYNMVFLVSAVSGPKSLTYHGIHGNHHSNLNSLSLLLATLVYFGTLCGIYGRTWFMW
jgi:hypothetical protein